MLLLYKINGDLDRARGADFGVGGGGGGEGEAKANVLA